VTLLEGIVSDLSHDARGVVRVDGKVYFVEGALPGETITFTRQKRRRRHEIGRLESIVEAAGERVEPPCEYFGVCGGCAIQHLSSAGQRVFKQRMVMENLERIGKVVPGTVLEPILGPVSGYRRKARLGVRHVPKKGGVLVGFRERNKSYITSLAHCIAQPPSVSALLPALHTLVTELSCFDRLPQIETACGDAHCALVFRHLQALENSDLERLARFSRELDVDIYLQDAGVDSVRPLDPASTRQLYYLLPEHDIRIEFGPTDFIQVNGEVNRLMVNRALTLLEPAKEDEILELFCGIGNFSLPFARHAGRVVGAEGDRLLVERARSNALLNDLDNTEFVTADLYTDQVESLSRYASCNKLFLDPPRSGAVEVVRDLVPKLRPERIVYVSCNPATLARDSEILVHQQGYTLTAAGIIDMFPHTAHVESVALFQR
jgi:23S rRNA (uracil1939-C5)-methyltransferase